MCSFPLSQRNFLIILLIRYVVCEFGTLFMFLSLSLGQKAFMFLSLSLGQKAFMFLSLSLGQKAFI